MSDMTQTSANNGGAPAEQPFFRPRPPRPPRREKGFLTGVSQVILAVWGLAVTLPLIWAFIGAVKSDKEILSSPWGMPATLQWGNFADAWSDARMGEFFLNTVIVLAGSVTGTMVLGAMAAYVLARFEFPGNRLIYYVFIAGMAFPVFLAMVPLFGMMRNMGILNTHHGLILVYIAHSMPFTVFFLHAFFRTLPTSIAEAALIDGASHTRTFFQVMMPLAKPGLISIGIFNFLGQWNQYMLPLVLNQQEGDQVLTQGLASLAFNSGYDGKWGLMFAGIVLATLPVLVVYIAFQRQVQAGLTAGALK
jgi:N-acetylglucosamine transport system permease protein